MTFGEMVRAARIGKKYTLEQVALCVGVSHQTIMNIEKLSAEPKLSTGIRLVSVLGLDISAVLALFPVTSVREARIHQLEAELVALRSLETGTYV